MKTKLIAILAILMLLMLVLSTPSAEILENQNCIVIGMTNQTWDSDGSFFRDVIGPLLDRLYRIYPYDIPHFIFSMMVILAYYYLTHLRFKMDIAFGSDFPGHYNYSSDGWIWTKGRQGIVEYNGSFYGSFDKIIVRYETMIDVVYSYVGIRGFNGYVIGLGRTFNNYSIFFIGYADHVKIDTIG